MDNKPKLFLTVSQAHFNDAALSGFSCACLFYRIAKGPALARSNTIITHRGGIMAISDKNFEPGGTEYGLFAREIMGELTRRGYAGVLFDIEDESLSELVSTVTAYLLSRQVPVFVSPRFFRVAKGAFVLIPSAISGGSYEQMLRDAADKYGAEQLALEVVRISSDFTLPFTSSDGKKLTTAELMALSEKKGASVFFSRELCAKYFTYGDSTGSPHFVLFDDASTLSAKLQIAGSFGIKHAFALYPEIKELLGSLSEYK
ncbi:MAG: hypothetical protein N2Z65_06235 [Clostridiales bacterium]|nr:hypothetical protein [Clostridiales bacterium]